MALTPERQGDALWFSATAKGLTDLEDSWDLWTGKWAIISGLDSGTITTHLSGNLTKTATMGKFYGHATATSMSSSVPVGKYHLVCKAYCTSIDYEKTFAVESLTVKPLGIE